MRGLVRILVMFLPMIIRQFQRRQGSGRRRGLPNGDQTFGNPGGYQDPRGRNRQREYQRTPPPPPQYEPTPASQARKPKLTEAEKNLELKEDEFMIDADVLDDYQTEKKTLAVDQIEEEIEIKDTLPEPVKEDDSTDPIAESDEEEMDLKDIFFKDKDERAI